MKFDDKIFTSVPNKPNTYYVPDTDLLLRWLVDKADDAEVMDAAKKVEQETSLIKSLEDELKHLKETQSQMEEVHQELLRLQKDEQSGEAIRRCLQTSKDFRQKVISYFTGIFVRRLFCFCTRRPIVPTEIDCASATLAVASGHLAIFDNEKNHEE